MLKKAFVLQRLMLFSEGQVECDLVAVSTSEDAINRYMTDNPITVDDCKYLVEEVPLIQ